MKQKRTAWLIVGTLIIGLAVVAIIAKPFSKEETYEGLRTTIDVTFGEGEKELLIQKLAVLEESLRQQKESDTLDPKIYVEIAETASALGDLVKTREAYEEYIQFNNLDLAPRLNYARTLMEMHDYKAAEDEYVQILSIGGAYEGTFRGLVEVFEKQNEDGSKDEAIKNALEAGVEVVGQTSWFMAQLAEWYRAHGDCEQAKAHLEIIARTGESEDAREFAAQDIADLDETCQASQ